MSLIILEFLYGITCVFYGIHYFGIALFFYFFTNWGLIIETFTLLSLCFKNSSNSLIRIMLITSWTLGWMVSLMFWLYVYQTIDRNKLPPFWHYSSTHGGVHLLIVKEFFNSGIIAKPGDYRWPLSIILFYLFCTVLPLKYVGVIIYPYFFDELLSTIAIILGAVAILILSFLSGFYLSKKKKKV